MNITKLLLYLFLYIFFKCCRGLCNDIPDPVYLLKGIISSREQIPPTLLKTRHEVQNPFINNIYYYTILFDRELRYYSKTNNGEVLNMLFNGSDVLQYFCGKSQHLGSVYIRSISQQTSDALFDPRILGLSVLFWSRNINNCIPYSKELLPFSPSYHTVSIIGKELIDDKDTWHINIFFKGLSDEGVSLNYWVDPNNRFRVYKYEEIITNVHHIIINSKYDDKYKWLPTYVEELSLLNNGKLSSKYTITILEAKERVNIPSTTWTIAGLNPPKGAEIVDLRIQKGIGFWDGKKVVKRDELNPSQQPKVPRTVLIGVMMVVFLAPLLVMLLRKFRKAM